MTTELSLQSANGRTWNVEVHQMTLRMSLTATKLEDQARENPMEDLPAKVLAEFFYPTMAACTTCKDGPVPTLEEFFELPAKVANSWYEAVVAENPGVLPEALGEAPVEASAEKKES